MFMAMPMGPETDAHKVESFLPHIGKPFFLVEKASKICLTEQLLKPSCVPVPGSTLISRDFFLCLVARVCWLHRVYICREISCTGYAQYCTGYMHRNILHTHRQTSPHALPRLTIPHICHFFFTSRVFESRICYGK